jgi:hypothetical protein
MTNMIKIMSEHYFLDLDEIDKFIQMPPNEATSGNPGENHISIVKYETIKLMLEVIMDEHEEIDETLGSKSASNLSIPFRLAFNTLLSKKLLKSF